MPRLRPVKSRPRSIVGFALISSEGMIADADRAFPAAIVNEADHTFFHAGLDQVQACVHGRHSHEGGPNARNRARLIVTRRVAALEHDPEHTRAMLWNPAGASFEEAWRSLAIDDGSLAVIGGTDVFGMFLAIGYDAFHLSRSPGSVPGGRPVFPEVPNRTPEQVLMSHGMRPGSARVLDEKAGVSVVTWIR